MEKLRISLVQTDLYWENPVANLAMLEEKISGMSGQADLIVLPEMFNTGFSTDLTEPMNFTTHKWMKQMAAQTGATLAGSVGISENNQSFNRLMWVDPSGNLDFYDKKHLFKYGGENKTFSPGNKKIVRNIKGFNICPLICYDLRFPVWSRNINRQFDVLIYVASWPDARIEAWKTLLKARAIENQCYVVGVNRIGEDGNGLRYNGQSALIDFQGKVLHAFDDQEGIATIEIEKAALEEFRNRFPFYEDADKFEILS
jgi:omega-amidase